jgi:hypothetical protein
VNIANMPNNLKPLHIAAVSYGILVLLLSIWAWFIDVKLLHSGREHLLPDVLLGFVGMPSSMTIVWVYEKWPESFVGLWQTAYLSVCALAQVGMLFMLLMWLSNRDKAGK